MKKLKNLSIVLLALVLGASCEDALDIVQDGELNNDATFQTVEDLRLYLNGSVYGSVGATNEIAFTSIFTDETSIGIGNGGQAIELHRFVLNASDGYASGIWLNHYTIINRVNRLLEGATLVEPNLEPGDLARFNSIVAQARTIRAYSYLQLESYFSTNMADDSALGVMLLDFVPPVDTKLPRVANSEIFALIESDLEFAKDNIGIVSDLFPTVTPANTYKYASVNLINSIYARFYLYRKNYTLAKQYAQEVVSTSGLSLTIATPYVAATFYNPTSTANPYRRIWADLAQGEVLWSLSRPAEGTYGNIASSFFFNTSTATGGAYLEMGRNLFNELSEVSGDIRRLAFVDPTSVVDPTYLTNPNYINSDILVIDKYPGKGNQPLRNDLKMFRLSEMYFILAECAVAEGQLPVAAGYIKNIRDARNRLAAQPLPVYANATDAWGDILDERRKELCLEGFRYLDIKRLGVLGNKSIDRNITDDPISSLPTTIPNTDYRFTLPIPQDEVAGNPTIQQNPGY